KDVRFHQLHAKDGSRILQKRFCAEEGVEVGYEELAKGYEIAPGQYVLIEPEELEDLDPIATHTVDIEDFVALDEIDPLFFASSSIRWPPSSTRPGTTTPTARRCSSSSRRRPPARRWSPPWPTSARRPSSTSWPPWRRAWPR